MKLSLALFAAFLLLAGSAQAQINPFKGNKSAPRLDDSDLPLLEQAGQKLLGDKAPAKGASESWTNDATGNAGTVSYAGPTTRRAEGATFSCRRLKYTVTLKLRPAPRTTTVAWCHLPDGTWKMN